jgi:hypothetical protein
MSATLATLDAILKDFYLGPIVNQLNNEILAVELFQKAQVDWQGKKAVIPVKVGRNTGVDFLAESAALPTAGEQKYTDLLVNARFVYGRFQVTGPTIEASKTSAGAFVQAIDSEMTGLVEDVKNAANKGMFDGGSVIGYVWEKKSTGPAPTVWQYAGATTTATNAAFLLANTGSLVNLVQLDDYSATVSNVQVNAITNKTITLSGSVDTSAVPAGVPMAVVLPAASVIKYSSAGAWNLEPSGIQANLSAPSFFSNDRSQAANAELRAVHKVVDASTDLYGSLTLRAMEAVIDEINEKSGKKPDLILINDLMRVEYASLLQGVGAQNLFVPTDKASDGHGGFQRLFYNGIEIKSSRHAPRGLFYFLSSKVSWKLTVLGEGGFMDQDGSVLYRVPNTDAYEGTYRWYYNLVCTEPHANGILCAVSF